MKKQSFNNPPAPPKTNLMWELAKPKKSSMGSLPQRHRAKTNKENSYFGHKKHKAVRTSPDQQQHSWKHYKSPKVEKVKRQYNAIQNFKTGKKEISKESRKHLKVKSKDGRNKKHKSKYQNAKAVVRSNPKKKMGRRDRPKNFSSKAEYASLKKTGRQLGPLDFRSYTNKENRRVPISCKSKGINADRQSKTTLLGLFLQKKCENLEHLLKSKITKAKRKKLENVFRKENSQITGAYDILSKKKSMVGNYQSTTQDRRKLHQDHGGSTEGFKIRFSKPSITCIGSIDNNINSLQKMNVRGNEELSSKSRVRKLEASTSESPFNFQMRLGNGSISQKESVIRSKKVTTHGSDGNFHSKDANFHVRGGKYVSSGGLDIMNNVTSNLILAKMRKENQMAQNRDQRTRGKATQHRNPRNTRNSRNSRKNGQFPTQGRKKDRVSGLKRRKSKTSKNPSTHQISSKNPDLFKKLFSNKFSEQERRLKLRSINEIEDFRNSRSIKNSTRTGKQGRQQMFQKKGSLPDKPNRDSFRLFKSKVAAKMRTEKSIRERKSLKFENNVKRYGHRQMSTLQK